MKDLLAKHYEDVVSKTWNYAGRCETHKDHVMNAVLGLGGEAGEIVDLHKKMYFHSPKDRTEELELELGDLCFYLSTILHLYDLKLEDILEKNKIKLFERHNVRV